LLCVIFSIIAVYTGIFTNVHGNDKLKWVSLFPSIYIAATALCSWECKSILHFFPIAK
jgi:hypothetical protein